MSYAIIGGLHEKTALKKPRCLEQGRGAPQSVNDEGFPQMACPASNTRAGACRGQIAWRRRGRRVQTRTEKRSALRSKRPPTRRRIFSCLIFNKALLLEFSPNFLVVFGLDMTLRILCFRMRIFQDQECRKTEDAMRKCMRGGRGVGRRRGSRRVTLTRQLRGDA